MRFAYKRLAMIGVVISLLGYGPIHSQDGSPNWTLPDLKVITPENAANLQYLGSLGYGAFPYPTWSPDSQTLLVATTAGVWVYSVADVENSTLIPDLNGVLGFTADGTAFFADDIWGKTALVELDTLQRTQPVAPPASPPDYTYFLNPDAPPLGQWTTTSPDGRYLVTERPTHKMDERSIRRDILYRITDTTTDEIVGQVIGIDRFSFYTYSGHYFTPQFLDSGFLYIRDFKLWRWNPTTRREELLIDRINDYVLSPDGHYMVLFSFPPFNSTPMTLTLWGISGPHATRLFQQTFPGNDPWSGFAVNPNGQEIAVGGSNDNLRRWNLSNRGQTFVEDNPPNEVGEYWVFEINYSLDGQWMADCREGILLKSICYLREASTGAIKASIRFPLHVTALAFQPINLMLAIGLEDGTIRFWQIPTLLSEGEDVDYTNPDRIFTEHTSAVTDLVFSDDGKHMVSGSNDGVVLLWDMEEERVLRAYGSGGGIWAVDTSPDGRFLMAGSDGGTVGLWDSNTSLADTAPLIIFTAKPPDSYGEHRPSVTDVAFSPDGRLAVAAQVTEGVYLWDSQTRSQVAHLPPIKNFCSSCETYQMLAFNPAGTLLIVVAEDTIQLWGVPK